MPRTLRSTPRGTDMIETLLEDMRWVKTYGPNIFVGLPSIYQHYRLKIGVPTSMEPLALTHHRHRSCIASFKACSKRPSAAAFVPQGLAPIRMAEWLNKSIYHMKNVKKHEKTWEIIWMISSWTLTESSTAARFREPFICLSVWP